MKTKKQAKKQIVIRARCDSALEERVQKFAAKLSTDPSHVLRLAVLEYLRRYEESEIVVFPGAMPPEPKLKLSLGDITTVVSGRSSEVAGGTVDRELKRSGDQQSPR